MFTIYWSSVWIGAVFGLVLGIAISVLAIWLADRQLEIEYKENFSLGFHRGWECGTEYQKLSEKGE